MTDPTGARVGTGTVGQPFTGGGLTFTLSDGSTDFAVGDGFILAVLLKILPPYERVDTAEGTARS